MTQLLHLAIEILRAEGLFNLNQDLP